MYALHPTIRTFGRILSVFVFVCIVTATVNAYTVIMRGGRHIEIPSSFVVTTSTLTYEVSPGVQVTLNLAAIDIPATETANQRTARKLAAARPGGSSRISTACRQRIFRNTAE